MQGRELNRREESRGRDAGDLKKRKRQRVPVLETLEKARRRRIGRIRAGKVRRETPSNLIVAREKKKTEVFDDMEKEIV